MVYDFVSQVVPCPMFGSEIYHEEFEMTRNHSELPNNFVSYDPGSDLRLSRPDLVPDSNVKITQLQLCT